MARKSRSVLLLTATAAALVVTPAASAAPDGTVNYGQPSWTWSGGPMNGPLVPAVIDVVTGDPETGSSTVRCTPVYECDDTLVHVEEPGDLAFRLEQHPGPVQGVVVVSNDDIDLYVYASDAEGTVGMELGRSFQYARPELVELFDAPAGYYLVRAATYNGVQPTYDAGVTLTAG
jgi:hypothetical protein